VRTVLIANRGEIALRVARTCREMGLRVVAVHSTEDADGAVVRYADESVQIGPAPAARSYLNMSAVIEAAVQRGADAVHPGYGFLSEDADFAEACAASGLVFVGPPPDVLARLGDKRAALAFMERHGVPVLPGSREALHDRQAAVRLAAEIGYPVIVKAAAGGGGRGMRVVDEPADLPQAFEETRASAQLLFGQGDVYVERYLPRARHVEVQVLCDDHGNAVHLGERDCSVQRRHQKLVEEAPAPGVPRAVAEAMGAAALAGARAVGYRGAGTFEFLLDGDDRFYFIEVNGRIQVEHPVTEMVTGVDVVREQLLVADGRPLSVRQGDVTVQGAAIECRVNAEDPDSGFAPTPGRLDEWVMPGGPFVRVDTHLGPGDRVSAAYDSLVAKVVVWAPDRTRAIARMRRALDEVRVAGPGVRTTAAVLADVVRDPAFVGATHTTGLVTEVLERRRAGTPDSPARRTPVTPGRRA
jgi:acetyl-CoA carboxylase biotin carboxylase subunit